MMGFVWEGVGFGIAGLLVGALLGFGIGRRIRPRRRQRSAARGTGEAAPTSRPPSEKEKRALRELQLFLQYDGFSPKDAEEQTEE